VGFLTALREKATYFIDPYSKLFYNTYPLLNVSSLAD